MSEGPRVSRRRFLGGAVMLGSAALVGGPPMQASEAAPHEHAPHPAAAPIRYETVVERRVNPAGAPYNVVVSRPAAE
jgi:hypothetical protein